MEQKSFFKRHLSVIIGLCIAAVLLAGVCVYAYYASLEDDDDSTLSEEQQEYLTEIVKGTVYDVDAQSEIRAELDALIEEGEYTLDNILVEYNPFYTNNCSLYIYFVTEDAADVTYTVSVDDDEISDFTQNAYQEEDYVTVHEFQVIGLIANMENTVTFTLTYEDGTVEEASITYEMGDLMGEEETILAKTEYDSDAEVEDGLYVILGNDSTALDFIYYYDNDGILRGEIPIIAYRAHRYLFDENGFYYNISQTKFAYMNKLGQIEQVYSLGDYKIHHDYVFNEDGDILFLATDTTSDTAEDVICLLDVETGEVTEIIDMGDLWPDYKADRVEEAENSDSEEKTSEEEELDWAHINSIQFLDDEDDSIIISVRETSTIVKISHIYDEPEIVYMIGSEEFWEDYSYSEYLLEKIGDFTIQGGQHCVTYLEDDSLEEGQYYLYLFDNNFGKSSTRADFDWDSTGLTYHTSTDGSESYYYLYLVDENEGTFTLVESIETEYSPFVSSIQYLETNKLIDTGMTGTFTEYDENNEPIVSYTMEMETFIYRVFKYQLD